MRTAYITHPDCKLHDTGLGHPESSRRLAAIDDMLVASKLFDDLKHIEAIEVTDSQLLRVHTADYLAGVKAMIPEQGVAYLDPDTVICPYSLRAARRAAGAVIKGVELVMQGDVNNVFCAVRPPGHHAESSRAMGFCIFNNIAVGVAHALAEFGLNKVAILDFDVHQGNGTEEIFLHDERVIFCSTFQHPYYPNSRLHNITDRLVSVPLAASAGSEEFRCAVLDYWLPALERFQPQMIFVSAGFDAHQDDEMSNVSLTDGDYQWIAQKIMQVADYSASGRIVSTLEGGYELRSLVRSVEKYIRVLMGLY